MWLNNNIYIYVTVSIPVTEWDPVEENTFRLAYKRYAAMKFRIYTSSIT
jgi:hypothetical protein